MKTIATTITLLLSLFTAKTLANPAQDAFLKTPLLELNHPCKILVLSDLYNHSFGKNFSKKNGWRGRIYQDTKTYLIANGSEIEIDYNKPVEHDKTIYILLNTNGSYVAISNVSDPASTITIADFNKLYAGIFKIVKSEVPDLFLEEPNTEESIRLDSLDLPAKIRFEEDVVIGVMQDKVVFPHPTESGKEIQIKFKEKLNRRRVIAKSTEFIIQSIVMGGYKTQLLIASDDIASIDCVNTRPRIFNTSDFYEIMGSKASLIQNTQPPTPVK